MLGDMSSPASPGRKAANALVVRFPCRDVVALANAIYRADELLETDRFPSCDEPLQKEVLYAMKIMARAYGGDALQKFVMD